MRGLQGQFRWSKWTSLLFEAAKKVQSQVWNHWRLWDRHSLGLNQLLRGLIISISRQTPTTIPIQNQWGALVLEMTFNLIHFQMKRRKTNKKNLNCQVREKQLLGKMLAFRTDLDRNQILQLHFLLSVNLVAIRTQILNCPKVFLNKAKRVFLQPPLFSHLLQTARDKVLICRLSPSIATTSTNSCT